MRNLRLYCFWLGCWLLGGAWPCAGAVSFKKEIAPLLNRRCAACHNAETPKGRYQLDTFASMQKPGESEEMPVVAGKSGESEIYRLLTATDPHDRMPQKADALPKEEVDTIRRWIDEGAPFDGGAPTRPLVQMARESFLRAAPEHYARPMPITALAFSPDGTLLAVAGYYEVTLWETETGRLQRRIGGLPERITALSWSQSQNLLAATGGSPAQWGTVALIDPAANYQVRLLCDLPESALCVAFAPDGKTLAAGAGDRTIRFFCTGSGKEVRVLRQHADWVQSLSYNSRGTRLVSGSRDRTARVFDVATGDLEATYTGHETGVVQAVFQGNHVLSIATRSREVHYWNPEDMKEKPAVLKALAEPLQMARLAGSVAYLSSDEAVRLVRQEDGDLLFKLQGHRDTPQSVAVYEENGFAMLATGAANGEVCVWNLDCGTWAQRFIAAP